MAAYDKDLYRRARGSSCNGVEIEYEFEMEKWGRVAANGDKTIWLASQMRDPIWLVKKVAELVHLLE